METITGAQMRDLEAKAIASGCVTGLELMERAGQGVIEAIFEEWPTLATGPHTALVLCGPGNNGGDGFVIARLLKDHGWDVEVLLYGDPSKLPADAATNYGRCDAPVTTRSVDPPPMRDDSFSTKLRPHLLVDSLFGDWAQSANARNCWDLHRKPRCLPRSPSSCRRSGYPKRAFWDSGEALGAALHADLTVTFHRPKPGHFRGSGPAHCGKLVVKDIGL